MTRTTVLLLLAIVPCDDVLVERVDVIELNHYYSDAGELTLTQWIFWDWSPTRRCYIVRDWRLARPEWRFDPSPSGGGRLLFHDSQTLRQIAAASFRETWTQPAFAGDPEMVNRVVVPCEQRRRLARQGSIAETRRHGVEPPAQPPPEPP